MEITKLGITELDLGKVARNLDAKSCRIFLLFLSKADEQGNVAEGTSLSSLHKETAKPKVAVSTLSQVANELKDKGMLSIVHDAGRATKYKVLPPEDWNI